LPAAMTRIKGWIKEDDYYLRQIVLPANSETAWITLNRGPHLIGEITFSAENENRWFQVVPTQAAKLEEIEKANDKCVKSLPRGWHFPREAYVPDDDAQSQRPSYWTRQSLDPRTRDIASQPL